MRSFFIGWELTASTFASKQLLTPVTIRGAGLNSRLFSGNLLGAERCRTCAYRCHSWIRFVHEASSFSFWMMTTGLVWNPASSVSWNIAAAAALSIISISHSMNALYAAWLSCSLFIRPSVCCVRWMGRGKSKCITGGLYNREYIYYSGNNQLYTERMCVNNSSRGAFLLAHERMCAVNGNQ